MSESTAAPLVITVRHTWNAPNSEGTPGRWEIDTSGGEHANIYVSRTNAGEDEELVMIRPDQAAAHRPLPATPRDLRAQVFEMVREEFPGVSEIRQAD